MAKRSKIKAVGRLEQVGEAGKRRRANLRSGGQEFRISSGAPFLGNFRVIHTAFTRLDGQGAACYEDVALIS